MQETIGPIQADGFSRLISALFAPFPVIHFNVDAGIALDTP
jgi:hypothetical protein